MHHMRSYNRHVNIFSWEMPVSGDYIYELTIIFTSLDFSIFLSVQLCFSFL